MAPRGDDGSWFRNATEETKGLDSISMRMSGLKPSDDGEEEYSGSCFSRGRRVYSDTSSLKGAPFARLDAHQDAEGVKARVLGALSSCCGQTSGGGSKGSSSRWEDHDLIGADGCCKAPTTYWKQLARRAKAHVHVRQAAPHPLNYDPHSYQMNFDDGCRREDRVSSFLIDENDDPASRERAMQSALLKKFAASRAQQVGP